MTSRQLWQQFGFREIPGPDQFLDFEKRGYGAGNKREGINTRCEGNDDPDYVPYLTSNSHIGYDYWQGTELAIFLQEVSCGY